MQGWPPQSAYAEVRAWRGGDPPSSQQGAAGALVPLCPASPPGGGVVAHDPTPSRAEGGANPGRPDPERTPLAQGGTLWATSGRAAWALARADPGPLARLRQHLQEGLWGLCARRRGRCSPPFCWGEASPPESLPRGPAGVTGRGPSLVVSGFHLGLVLVALRVLTALLTPGLAGRWLVLPASLLLAAYGVLTGRYRCSGAWLGALLLLMTLGLGRGSRPGRGLALAALVIGLDCTRGARPPGRRSPSLPCWCFSGPGGGFGPPGSADPPGASVFGHGCPPCHLLWLDARRGPGGESIPGAAPRGPSFAPGLWAPRLCS